MNFLNPAALWFALLAVPIIVFYLLKIRRKEVEISSTLLWRMALRDQQANAPWQKPRRNLLLLLQLTILSMMVLAVARLAFPMPSFSRGSVVLLIDGSASMLASDVQPTRFAQAIEIARDMVRAAGTDAAAAAILVTDQPQVLFAGGTEKSVAADLLGLARPALSEADWEAAFSLASGLIVESDQAEKASFVILSDGGLPVSGLPPLPGETRFIPIGRSSDNLAVTNLAARVLPSGETAELFVRATNFGEQERSAVLTITKDGEPLQTQQLRLEPEASADFIIAGLPVADSIFEAHLANIQADLPLDPFKEDDAAYTVLVPPSARSVLLVSRGNLFLERLLLLFPNLSASRTAPDENGELNLGNTPFDLYIFDGVLPAGSLPPGQLLLIHPPENEIVDVLGDASVITRARPTDHPLAAFLDWSEVNVFQARRMALPEWGIPLVTAEETPLVFVGEHGGRRMAVVGFDLHDSDLPLRITFPILFSNLFDYLAPQGMVASPNGISPGAPVEIRLPVGTQALSVTPPGDEAVVYDAPGANVLFSLTEQAGVYQVRATDGENIRQAAFAVNLSSTTESRIGVRTEIEIGRSTIAASGENEVSNREVWAWLIGLALAFLLVEWLAYHRRLG